MLVEIKCDIFREKTIKFHTGFNVILGDEKASNSIGKSNLVLIIDFIFGGDTYTKHSKDVIKHLGEHSFYFCFKFDNEEYKFKRSTNDSNNVFKCDKDYNLGNSISIDEFTKYLQEQYGINYFSSTFRNLIGAYLRIWGKDNYDIHKPLKTYKDDANEEVGINNLIKLFDKYNELEEINKNIKKDSESKKILLGMYRNEYTLKITKSQFEKNEKQIENIKNEIKNIENNVLKYVLNVEELINKEVLKLKSEKNKLLNIKNQYDNQLLRINKNLDDKVNLSSKHLEKLEEFFPNSNIKEIDKIEGFHKKIKNILSSEIKKSKLDIENKILLINEDISEIDIKIFLHLENETNPKYIIEKVYEHTIKLNELENINRFYKEKDIKVKSIITLKESLSKKLDVISEYIENKINNKMQELNKIIYSNDNSPIFKIENYKYSLYKDNDNGTGTSETNLIIFDLAVFKLTELPLLIHDMIVFKNIGNNIMESLISLYNESTKQVFISIDEHIKYKNVVKILEDKKVIKLDSKNTLFNKIWNDKK